MKPKAFNYTAYTDLEADLMIAKAELEKVKAERDAAIEDLHHVLISLGYDASLYGESICRYCSHHEEALGECRQDCNSGAEKWKWRGPQKEE